MARVPITSKPGASANPLLGLRQGARRGTPSFAMCRNIKPLFNFDPPATDEEVRAAALQFVRKLSGFNQPSSANERAFAEAVDAVSAIATDLIASLVTLAPPKNRELEAEKRRAQSIRRFGPR